MENLSSTPVQVTPIIQSQQFVQPQQFIQPQQFVQPQQIIESNISTSLFSKLFEYKYILILILIIIICIFYYYYKIKPKNNNQQLLANTIQDFVVADINGNIIKISGERIGEIKLPAPNKKNIENVPAPTPKQQQRFQVETSEEPPNTKQHDLTNSEINEITNKLKN